MTSHFQLLNRYGKSSFLDHHLQPITKQGDTCIRGTGYFLAKLKAADEVPRGATLVTADVAGLYPSILHSKDYP